MNCYTPNFSDVPLKPLSKWGDFNVFIVRTLRLWGTGGEAVAITQMTAWMIQRRTRTWKTQLYFFCLAVFFLVPLFDYEATGYRHLASWSVSISAWIAGIIAFAIAWEIRDMSFIAWITLYLVLGVAANTMATANVHAAGMETATLQLKLIVRLVIDPLIWESIKTTQRHAALLNPSPGTGLDIGNYLYGVFNQAVFSRFLLFMMTNDGTINVLTVQIILSMNELMLNLTLKHRDGFFTRGVLGTKIGDMLLSTEKADEIHVMSLIGGHFGELAAIVFTTQLMALFNLPSSADLPDGKTRTSDSTALYKTAAQLCALEMAVFFLTLFAQYRFHDVDIHRVFKKAEAEYLRITGGPRNTRLFSYRFWVYMLMTVFFFMTAVMTILGSIWTWKMCPRVRRDGHLYWTICQATETRFTPAGGAMNFLPASLDWPPWKSPYAKSNAEL